MSQEITNQDKYQYSIDALKNMQQEVQFEKASVKKSIWQDMLEQVPFVAEFVQHLDDTGEVTGFLLEASGKDTPGITEMAKGFHYTHVIFSAFDFLKIPIMYLSGYILGKEIPFKLSRLGKWAFSAIVLALMIAATVNPVVAPILLVVTSSLSLGLAVYTLERYFRRRAELLQEERQLPDAIAELEEKHEQNKRQATALRQQIETALDNDDFDQADNLMITYDELEKEYHETLNELQRLHLQQDTCRQKLTKYDTKAVMGKAVVVIVSTIALTGLGVALAVPPLGLGIAAAGAFIGLGYFVGSFFGPKLYNRFIKTNTETPKIDNGIDRSLFDEEEIITVEKTLEPEERLNEIAVETPGKTDSTEATMGLLNSEHLEAQALKEQLLETDTEGEEDDFDEVKKKAVEKTEPVRQITLEEEESEGEKEEEEDNEGEGEKVLPKTS